MLETDDDLTRQAVELSARGLAAVRGMGDHFLVKGPDSAIIGAGPIAFRTTHVHTGESGPPLPAWLVRPLRKRPDSPYPDRFGIGRAPNCDVVLRFAIVSKLHAHIHVTTEGFELTDNGSSNGTFMGDSRLRPGVRRSIALGDEVRFGTLPMTLMDASTLIDVLRGAVA